LPVQQVKWAEVFVPNPCAKDLRLVYGQSSDGLLSRFAAIVNGYMAESYSRLVAHFFQYIANP